MLPDELEFDDGGRRTLGVIDGTLTQLALAALMLLPTALACLFWPRALAPMVPAIEQNGRRGVFLAPGTFFLIGTLAIVLASAIFLKDAGGAVVDIGTQVGEAASEGRVWQIAATILPFFLAANLIGIISVLAGRIVRMPQWTLEAGVRSGFYAFLTLGIALGLAEPFSRLFGDGGVNDVVEPVAASVGGLAMVWFYGVLTSRMGGWRRALSMGALISVPVALLVLATYSL